MVTTQIIERPFYDGVVQQNHKTGFFNTQQIIELGNRYRKSTGLSPVRLDSYLSSNKTKEFIKQILEEESITLVMETKRGRYGGTWMHPLLFIDFAMYISPSFKYTALTWLTDNLLKNRDESGDNYKRMVHALDVNYAIGGRIGLEIPKMARRIKYALNVDDWNKANDEQLKKRKLIHDAIIFGSDFKPDLNELVDKAIKKVING